MTGKGHHDSPVPGHPTLSGLFVSFSGVFNGMAGTQKMCKWHALLADGSLEANGHLDHFDPSSSGLR